MKLEYLFLDKSARETLKNYTYSYTTKTKKTAPKTIVATISIHDFDNSEKWTLQIEMSGENETTAKHLSIINSEISQYKPIVLTNECAAYFNRMIYPLANEFERKLRKLLYLKSTLYTGEKPKKTIDHLEEKDFGKIYELLFSDEDFYNKFKQEVNTRKSSKIHYMKRLSEMTETTLWDMIVGVNNNDFIKENFLEITEYRNATMHAHNISYSDYIAHKRTFMKAIKTLDDEINKMIIYPESPERAELITETLYNNFVAIGEAAVKVSEMLHSLNYYQPDQKMQELIAKLLTTIGAYTIKEQELEQKDGDGHE